MRPWTGGAGSGTCSRRTHAAQRVPASGARCDRAARSTSPSAGTPGRSASRSNLALEPGEIWHGKTPRERALEVFAALGVWDTEANNGVLIYVLLADQDVEIVADRGFNLRVTSDQWAAICHDMERHFRRRPISRQGAVTGVREVGQLIAAHFPQRPGGRDGTNCRTGPRCSETPRSRAT